jgi:AcrR family transcriptional regulator
MASDAPQTAQGRSPRGEGGAAPSGAGAASSGAGRAAGAPRSRRDRPAKPALSRDAIVDAALDIVRAEGVEALSMRRVAQALDTGAASLYVYVANRDELHELLFDAAVATVATEEVDPQRWREQLKALVGRMVKTMVEDFPGLALLAMAKIPIGDNALRVTDNMLALLKAGGVGDQAAAYAADLISMYATAIAYEQSLYATLYSDPDHEQREIERIAQRFASLDPMRFPTLAALAPALTRGDGDERFELGLDVIVNGLQATPTEGRLNAEPRTG